ncbi:alpha/beta fold hydrolase [Actinoplanes sp. TFC3]|uniref:alpha/beta fold hydrolase n=1 Tax=Actinoplanes sp. TFC3 TaxID=1710355 RepID=UPI00082A80EF|nr:alpha/beta hydrolase [Actinoplanes sp. TFC3]
MDVTVLGSGPAVLLPTSIAAVDGPAAEEMRAWGMDPNAGHTIAATLVEAGFQVIAVDYEKELTDYPKPDTLTADHLAAGLLAVADQAGVDRFACYGYSWLALAGLQLAIRTDRLTALAMGGFPPLGAPYGPMLAVTKAAYQAALENKPAPENVEPGDWDAAGISRTPDQTRQYVTLYESLQNFDEREALSRVRPQRLVFAGENDNIDYGPKWGDTRVAIAEPLREYAAELGERGWIVRLIPGADHLKAMHAAQVLPILLPFLRDALRE